MRFSNYYVTNKCKKKINRFKNSLIQIEINQRTKPKLLACFDLIYFYKNELF